MLTPKQIEDLRVDLEKQSILLSEEWLLREKKRQMNLRAQRVNRYVDKMAEQDTKFIKNLSKLRKDRIRDTKNSRRQILELSAIYPDRMLASGATTLEQSNSRLAMNFGQS